MMIYCSNKTIVIETKNGKTVEVIENENYLDNKILFYKDNRHILRQTPIDTKKSTDSTITTNIYKISFEDFLSKKVIWQKEINENAYMNFSTNFSTIYLFSYKEDVFEILTLKTKSGETISKNQLFNFSIDSILTKYKNSTAYPVNILSTDLIDCPEYKYYLAGYSSYGSIKLIRKKDNKVIREFRFSSDIE